MVTMSRMREAAAMLVEQGRALGALEQLGTVATYVQQVAANMRSLGNVAQAEAMVTLAKRYLDELPGLARRASDAQVLAEHLMAELEHPGASFARRLVATWHGARAAWRGSR